MSFNLRWYQEESINALLSYNFNKNPLLALPTGAGKSVIIAEFIRRALVLYPNTRIMMLTHVKELVQQNAEKLLSVWPNAPLGIFSAGLRQKDTGYPITFGNMQSVVSYMKSCNEQEVPHFGYIDLLIVDECHLISEKDETSYRTIINELLKVNPNIRVIGLTATPYRMKSGSLLEGGIFGEVIYDITQSDQFLRLIRDGYLSPLIPKRTQVEIDVSNVSLIGGEYNLSQLAKVSDKNEITYNAVREIVETGLSQNRKAWLIFATSVEHCEHINAMLLSMGIDSATCHSKLKFKENDENIVAFKEGKLRCLVNNNKLTTGFDNPNIDLIGMLRPTQSVGLWLQMMGRGTRISPNKENCLVLDFAGNTKRLGPINEPNIPNRNKKKGEKISGAPVKVCAQCDCYNHARASVCNVCGAEFDMSPNLFAHSSSLELIVDNSPQYETFIVDNVIYNEHRTKNGKSTLLVTYMCGLNARYNEYICLEHEGWALKQARDWWRQRSGEDAPRTVYEALAKAQKLKKPISITVHTNKKYPEIVSVSF